MNKLFLRYNKAFVAAMHFGAQRNNEKAQAKAKNALAECETLKEKLEKSVGPMWPEMYHEWRIQNGR